MTNPEIINYIRGELQKGASRVVITGSLMANGWTSQDVDESFSAINPIPVKPIATNPVTSDVTNKKNPWERLIPRSNYVFLVISSAFLIGIDTPMALSDRSLLEFLYLMLMVFAVFVVFLALENFVFKKAFLSTQSKLDKWIFVLVTLRNILVLLNVIPYIQIIGMFVGFYAIWLYIPLYLVLISLRYSRRKKVVYN